MNGFVGKLAIASALVLFAAGASAQSQSGSMGSSTSSGTMSGGAMSGGGMGHMGNMQHMNANGSMHMMPATVKSVDTSTGVVEATTEGMTLKVHFPPKSVADLKAGDKITLHMGYTKP